jgi:hypothetical protein
MRQRNGVNIYVQKWTGFYKSSLLSSGDVYDSLTHILISKTCNHSRHNSD